MTRAPLRRAAKHLRHRLRPRADAARVLFVVGAQRSGTTLLLDLLDAHSETQVRHEHDRAAFDARWRLRPLARQQRLAARARCRWLVLKPLLDLQHLDHLLEAHPGSRALFLVRDPCAAARSAYARWGDALIRAVRRAAREEPCPHWLAERLPPARREELAALARADLDGVSAAALRWWLRNALFFDLALDRRGDEVMPLRYERLVREPEAALAEVFAHLELRPPPHAHRIVSDATLRREPGREPAADVLGRCRALEARLDAVIAARCRP